MTSNSSNQPAALGRYLAHRGFAPNPGNSTWTGCGTGQQIIRVSREPSGAILLICLTPRSVRLYQAVFSPGTPDAVITAAIEAALSPPPPQAARVGRTPGQRCTREGKRDPR